MNPSLGEWRAIRWATLLVAVSLVAAACEDAAEETTTTTSPPVETTTTTRPPDEPLTRPHGGEVVYGLLEEPASLNPLLPAGAGSRALALIGNAFTTGVRTFDPTTLAPLPRIVAELPTVANGGVTVNDDGTMTVRYTIRAEARWADGVPISGDDFLFTWETIMNEELPIARTVYENMMPEAFVVQPKAFEFTLESPNVAALDSVFDLLLPKHDVEGSDFLLDYERTTWISGGPFVFDEWEPGSFIRFRRNDAYWIIDPETEQELPYLDAIVFAFYPNPRDLLDAFRDGEVDIVSPPATVPVLGELERLVPDGARVEVVGGASWEHLAFSFSANSLARNPNSYNAFYEYRRAVAHAVDRQRIVDEIVGGYVEPMESYVDAFFPALSQSAWSRYDYDPDEARKWLDRLCGRVGVDCRRHPPTAVFTTTLGDEPRESIAGLLEEMFVDVGIAFRQELEPRFLFLGNTVDSGTWDLGLWSWVGWPALGDLVQFHRVFDPESTLPSGFNFYRYGTDEVQGETPGEVFDQGPSLIRSARTEAVAEFVATLVDTVDERELTAQVRRLESLLADDIVMIPLYQSIEAAAVWADRVGNFEHTRLLSASSRDDFARWYRVAKDE